MCSRCTPVAKTVSRTCARLRTPKRRWARAATSGARGWIVESGARAVPRLIELIDEHALAPAFNPPGSEAFAKHGAFTCESQLATSAVFALAQCVPVSNEQI